MEYANPETGVAIDLASLTEEEEKFYRLALRKFQKNPPWVDFDGFAFGLRSPLYKGESSHLDVRKRPLFLALKDMSLQLGIQQGRVKARTYA
jgi:hypothetical protein